ncbi:MAG: four helix bundle protein [Bacteroidetes bacterium HGW-Bacteroidetes-6]|nr:MAG: four helix bundle protein [Bacteroidetes bacterium HGW-Bacteroidetes-6]
MSENLLTNKIIEMESFNEKYRTRTKLFALSVLKILKVKNNSDAFRIMSKQLIRCSTSVAANFRAACRYKSQKDYHYKLSIVIEECDEAYFWLELLTDSDEIPEEITSPLMKEADELLAVFSKVKSNVSRK